MTILRSLCLSILTILMVVSAGQAQEKITVLTFPIPAMVVDNEHGVFVELTREIAKRAKLDIEFSINPPKRSFGMFFDKKGDVIFPALDVNFPQGIAPIKSKEIVYVKVDYVFTKKGRPFLKTIQDLENKKIGVTLGYPYVNELMQNNLITLDTATSDDLNTKKLMMERIDAFVVEEKSGLNAFRNEHLEDRIQYDPNAPMSKQNVYYAFQNTPAGSELEKRVSEVLATMKADGSFQAIMEKAN